MFFPVQLVNIYIILLLSFGIESSCTSEARIKIIKSYLTSQATDIQGDTNSSEITSNHKQDHTSEVIRIEDLKKELETWIQLLGLLIACAALILTALAIMQYRRMTPYVQIAKLNAEAAAGHKTQLGQIVQGAIYDADVIKARKIELDGWSPDEALSKKHKEILDTTISEARIELEKGNYGLGPLKILYQAKCIHAYGNENWPSALNYAEKYLDFDDTNAEMWHRWARCKAEIQDYKNSIIGYQKAIEIDNKLSKSYFNMGMSYLQLEQHSEAITCFERKVELDEDSFEGWYFLASCRLKVGNMLPAHDAIQKALTLNDRAPSAWNCLGQIYEVLANFEKAEKRKKYIIDGAQAYAKAFQLDSTNAEFRTNKNRMERKQNHFEI